MSIYMTARFVVRPEALETSREAIGTFVAYVREHEPGTRFYTSLVRADDPHSFLHVFEFEDEAARDVHRGSEGVKRFTDVLYPGLENGVEFTEYRPVDTT